MAEIQQAQSGKETPAALGFRMPAEWEPHAATWLAWPHNREDWPGKFHPIPWVYAEIVRNIASHDAPQESVHILVQDAAAEKRVSRILSDAGANLDAVAFHHWPTNRIWTRDYGPIFVCRDASRDTGRGVASEATGRREVALVDFCFNAWAKYPDWQLDDEVPSRVAEALGCYAFPAKIARGDREHRVVLEGGSIDVNGRGSLLTTEECLLSDVQQRNPGLGREDLERVFRDYLGVTNTIWLGKGVTGDDTHGHVDDIARFVSATAVVAAVEPDPRDANHAPLAENLARLRAARSEEGKQFDVIELPMPRRVAFKKQRVPASYANFYIANGAVLVPVFNDPRDRIALNALAEVFQDRDVVPIYCGDMIWGLGAVHCLTQQQPAGVFANPE